MTHAHETEPKAPTLEEVVKIVRQNDDEIVAKSAQICDLEREIKALDERGAAARKLLKKLARSV